MVQCDKCNLWYHFHCVLVNSRVADESWSFDLCSASGGINQIRNQPQASLSPKTTHEVMRESVFPAPTTSAISANHETCSTPELGEHIKEVQSMHYMLNLPRVSKASVASSAIFLFLNKERP